MQYRLVIILFQRWQKENRQGHYDGANVSFGSSRHFDLNTRVNWAYFRKLGEWLLQSFHED